MKESVLVVCLSLLLVGVAPAADSLNVRFVGGCDTPGTGFGVTVSGDHAYVADYDAGLRVISVSDPAHPVEVGYYDTPGIALGVAVAGNYAYVADYEAGLQIHQFYGAGVEETPNAVLRTTNSGAAVVRGILPMANGKGRMASGVLLNATGRKVLDLHAGANNVSSLAPGVYFVRERSAVSGEPSAVSVRKVVIAR